MSEQKLVFSQGRSYFLKKELGQGACGKTVLLYDEVIEEYFVCKKYSPLFDEMKQDLFKGFVGEIKLLHGVHHINVVRVFNYVLYPDRYIGYIFLEYVEGSDKPRYVQQHLWRSFSTISARTTKYDLYFCMFTSPIHFRVVIALCWHA